MGGTIIYNSLGGATQCVAGFLLKVSQYDCDLWSKLSTKLSMPTLVRGDSYCEKTFKYFHHKFLFLSSRNRAWLFTTRWPNVPRTLPNSMPIAFLQRTTSSTSETHPPRLLNGDQLLPHLRLYHLKHRADLRLYFRKDWIIRKMEKRIFLHFFSVSRRQPNSL